MTGGEQPVDHPVGGLAKRDDGEESGVSSAVGGAGLAVAIALLAVVAWMLLTMLEGDG